MRIRAVLAGILVGALLHGCATADKPTVASLTPGTGGAGQVRPTTDSAAVVASYVQAMRDYVRCYRSHGVPQMPDPDELGSILIDRRKVRIDPQASRRADLACKGKAVPVPAEVKELLDRRNAASITPEQKQQFAEYSHCMQTHGAPDFPDPGSDGVGDEREWDQLSAGASRATSACAPIIGAPANPGPGVG